MDTPQPPNIAERVKQYIQLRDLIKEEDDRHKKEMAPKRETLEQLNSVLLQYLSNSNVESMSTEFGTFYRTERKSASVADMEAFWTFVVATGSWDLLDKKANVSGIAEFIATLEEKAKTDPTVVPSPPPGVNYNVSYVAGVRRK